jgi:hypothetical protein
MGLGKVCTSSHQSSYEHFNQSASDALFLGLQTITALALIAADKEEEQRLRRLHASAADVPGLPPQPAFVPGRRPTLIVCPLSVIANCTPLAPHQL